MSSPTCRRSRRATRPCRGQDELALGLVDLRVDDGGGEHAAGRRLLLQRTGDLKDLLRLGRRGDDELDGEVSATGQRGRRDGKHVHSGKFPQLCRHLRDDLLRCPGALTPRLEDHAPETRCRLGQLERVGRLRRIEENARRLVGIPQGFLERGIGRRLADPEDHALVLVGGEFPRGHQEHRHAQRGDDKPHGVHRGPRGEDLVERPAVDVAQAVEQAVDHAGEPMVLHAGLEQLGAHGG